MIAAILASLLWCLLGAVKVAAPGRYAGYISSALGTDASVSGIVAGVTIALEILMGLAIGISAVVASRHHRLLCAVSCLVSISILVVAWVDPVPTGCGCFGAVAKATAARRMMVAAALLFLSAGAYRASQRFDKERTKGATC